MTPETYQEIQTRITNGETWLKARNNRSYQAEELPENCRVSNEELSAVEVYEFKTLTPDKYFLYIKAENTSPYATGIATTWTGDKLGDVQFGRSWRDNFGGTRVSITVRAINGKTYHGTYFKSAGDYARIRKFKEVA